MPKLRKMLGNVNDSVILSLMGLIETQSAMTLAEWSLDYVEEYVLDIYERDYPGERSVRGAIAAAREYLAGQKTQQEIKAIIKEMNRTARDVESTPAAQAAVRAVSTACATVYLPTSALGYTFYAAAALVYDQAGILEKQEVYDAMAKEEFHRMLASLRAAAVPNEKNPVKINWYC
ncbi:MAG: putative immunity protein [Roseburia sp.]